MTVPSGLLTIERILRNGAYIFSLENSISSGSLACAITSPTAGASLSQGTPVTITGTISVPGTVVVKLGGVTLGSATVVGFNWSYSWTPQVGDVGAQTLNATVTASVGGGTANAPGVAVTVAASGPINFATYFPGAYQIVQTDIGLTYGSTPYAAGTGTPPVGTLSGTPSGAVVPLLFKCTTAGTIGSGAVFAAYADGTGSTPFMTGITPSAGTPVSLTGVGAGMSMAWAAGTAALNHTWTATCSGLADQSGNARHYTQTSPTLQPLITLGPNGVASIANPTAANGIRYLESTWAAPGTTTPMMILAVFRALGWNAGSGRLIGDASFGNALAILQLDGSSPALEQYGASAGNISTDLAINAWGVLEAKFNNATTDYIKLGAAAAVTGTNCGNAGASTGRQIFARAGGNAGAFELAALIYTAPASTTAFRSAVTSKYGVSVAA
jgi:hypothetical protein